MHKSNRDTLKILAKGSPPFVVELLKMDSSILTNQIDSIGILKIPLASLRKSPGQYTVFITSHEQDTSFVITIKPLEQVALKKDKTSTTSSNKVTTRVKKSNQKRKQVEGEWSKWARTECFYEIWYRYRVWRYYEDTRSYRYEYQIYNGYDAKVIVRTTLLEPTDKALFLSLKKNGGELTSRTSEHHLRKKGYSTKLKVNLLSKDPYLFIWRMQSPTPVSPYIDCDNY